MGPKEEILILKPCERNKYPDYKSLSELKKIKLMPKNNAKPKALVCRAFYNNYFLYDQKETCTYQKSEKEAEKEKMRRRELKALYSCANCNKYVGIKKGELSKTINHGTVYCHECKEKLKDYVKKEIGAAIEAEPIPCPNKTNIICFDVETTGLYKNDEILQISVINGDGDILINEYVRPYFIRTWKEAESVNHITKEIVQDAPYPHELIRRVRGIFESANKWIAYNGSFDLGFLSEWGIKPLEEVEVIDVMQEFAPIYGEWSDTYACFKWKSLETCAEYYGFDYKAHDSLEDAKATLYCYKKINSK